MIAILLTIVVVVAFVALGSWLIRALLRYRCPQCSQEESSLMPVVPGFRWYCLGCEKMYPTAELSQNKD